MKSEAAKTQEYLDKFDSAESYYEKGRIAAEMYCYLHSSTPKDMKIEILRCTAHDTEEGNEPTEERKEMDRGGIAWCNEQLNEVTK